MKGSGRLLAGLVAASVMVLGAGPAAADPAGPTDYRTTIIEVDPVTAQIELRILGGDSFVELAAEPGTEVRVPGYEGEPYLWFDADGTVWRNERSPSRWYNDDRYGGAEAPPEADKAAEPQWEAVARGGVHAWHDHRAHWMNEARPIGVEPGGTVLEAVIPLEVSGGPVDVHVRSVLLDGPSPVAAILGAAGAVVLGLGALARNRGPRGGSGGARADLPAVAGPQGLALAAAVALWSGLALVVAVAAMVGLPAEAAPGAITWLLPLVALAVVVGALVVVGRGLAALPLRMLAVPAALALAGAELLLWAWLRRLVLTRALVPTSAPAWIDRAVVAGAVVVGLAAVVGAVLSLGALRPPTRGTTTPG